MPSPVECPLLAATLAMLPALTTPGLDALTEKFLHTLAALGFKGDIHSDYASRTVLATDNSIYQVLPQAVLYP
ncbi:MAG TPA: hypothetical protein PKC70_16765, partial [Cellvibrionaceae bacterium]|nr:hypothetical protein [Cellvibrionaceae bacterium]